MSQRPTKKPSTPSAKARHQPLRTSESIADINNLPVAFGIVTPTSSEYGPATASRSRSSTAYNRLMRNEDEARRVLRSEGSLADISALPAISSSARERDAKTVGKRLISAQSCDDLRQLPELARRSTPSVSGSDSGLTLRNSDYAYGPYSPMTLRNSDYAYYPPVLRNSDYAYSYDKCYPASTVVTPTNSSYCYMNPDGTCRLTSSYPPARARSSSPNPYAALPGYRMDRIEPGAVSSRSLVGTEPIPSAIYLGGYERELPPPRAPNSETLNKNMRGIVSVEDLTRIEVTFTETCVGDGRGNCCPLGADMATAINSTSSSFGRQAIRDFCRESMEELRQLPSISSYALDQPEPNVHTARSIRTPECTCPSKKTVTCMARSTRCTDQDGLKYCSEAAKPACCRRRRRSSSSRRQ